MSPPEIPVRRWKRLEYERLVEGGFLGPGDPIELLGGQLIVAEPQGSRHFAAIRAAEEALRSALGPGWEVRGQGPLALDDESEPEPDLAVVPGSFRDYRAEHPSRPVLVVEVAESSLLLDREHKGSLYARARIADYWIINLVDHALEIYREPARDASAVFGWRYGSRLVPERDGSVSPLARLTARVRVADLLL
ncbi:MAG TPA: Uma2 family endonuclease [Methylomirabilota bacterium]|jgi:Uma2 family endonuclease|nr:Uma2 family endonuclease [Methylomirabilota bacterium]